MGVRQLRAPLVVLARRKQLALEGSTLVSDEVRRLSLTPSPELTFSPDPGSR